MRFTIPSHISSKPVLKLIAAVLSMALLFAALAYPAPASAQTPTPSPTPEVEQTDDAPKPEAKEPDPETEGRPADPVVDEPRTDPAQLSNNAQSVPAPASSHTQDYDGDNDGLIEISTLEQLNAIRWDLNGTGSADRNSDAGNFRLAFPNAVTRMGCPSSGCRGYELTRSLDFNSRSSYASRSVNTNWTQGVGWLPIGYRVSTSESAQEFSAIFDGNYHNISNLYFDRRLNRFAGLFAINIGTILGVGMIDVDLTAGGRDAGSTGPHLDLGGLAGYNGGLIAYSHSTGSVSGDAGNVGGLVGLNDNEGLIAFSYSSVNVIGEVEAGGLVGDSHNEIVSSYATGSVRGISEVGGLIGDNENGVITYSYSTGRVTGNSRVGGFTGDNASSVVTTSYWDVQTSGQSQGAGAGPISGIEGKTTAELQSPIGYYGIYANWYNSGDVWEFGTSTQYPGLKAGIDLALNNCEESISNLGRVRFIGLWAGDCLSTHRSGRYARYYTFTLHTASTVTINLISTTDPYLFLLEGAGRNSRIITSDDDGGTGRNSRISRRLQAGTYTVEATTYSSSQTGFFRIIMDGVPLTPPPPPFTLSRSLSKSSVEVGESFDLNLRLHNVGGSGEHGGISVSFPSLTTEANDSVAGNRYSSIGADVERVSYTSGLSSVTFHKPGEARIYHSDRNRQFTARDLLVESDDPSWSRGADRTLTLRITPNQEGEFPILVRGWICASEYTNCSRRPSSGGTRDQQGWRTYELTVNVVARAEPPQFNMDVEASKDNASVSSINLGETFTIEVQIYNVQGEGAHGGASVSFPQLTTDAEDSVTGDLYSSAVADVTREAYTTGLSQVTFYKPGEDTIFHSDNNRQFTARDLLVESDDPSWSQDADRTLTLLVKPKQEGEFRILARGWICVTERENCRYAPESGTPVDQQGRPARELVINVTPSATQPEPTPQPGDECETQLTEDGNVDGEWVSDCDSENKSGSYAHYYTFTLSESADVEITLESDEDTYLYLLEGAGKDGRVLFENDDHASESDCAAVPDLGKAEDSCIATSLDAGDYTIEATTYNAATTGDFTLTVSGIGAATQPPTQQITLEVEDFQTHVEVGQPFTFTVRMHDVQQAGEHGGISVSFPSLTEDDGRSDNSYTSSVVDVEVASVETTVSNVHFYRAGDEIYYSDDPNNPSPAQHLLVESDESWEQDDDKTMTLQITPKQEGEFPIRIRGWICADTTDEGEYTNCSRHPSSSGTRDQQGWLAVPLNITVTTPAERLAHKYAPILRMHPDEWFFPKGVEVLVDNAALKDENDALILARGSVTLDNLGQYAGEKHEGYYLDVPDNIDNIDNFNTTPQPEYPPKVYAAIQDRDTTFGQRVFLQYYLFYYYDYLNPGFQQTTCATYNIPIICDPHEADWELIQLEFEADDISDILNNELSPIKISLSQHSWSDNSDYENIPTVNGHSIAYVSQGKHANYFGPDPDFHGSDQGDVVVSAGDNPWSLSFVQDEISDRGKELLPPALSDYATNCPDPLPENFHACTYTYELEIIDESTPWVAYRGSWGDSKMIYGPDTEARWDTPDEWVNEAFGFVPTGGVDKNGPERDRAILNATFHHLLWSSIQVSDWSQSISTNNDTRVHQLIVNPSERTLPPSLSDLSHVEVLDFTNTKLTGTVPHQIGYLSQLKELHLNENALTGSLPRSLTKLVNLEKLYFQNNAGLCAPTDDEFQNWLDGLDNKEGLDCP